MTRYFYYQLANVFVSVGLGSLANSLHQIIDNPSSILSILGTSLPSLSIYFTNLIIVKTFTAVPLELLRVWPLMQILSVRMCLDRNKCTIRELKTGTLPHYLTIHQPQYLIHSYKLLNCLLLFFISQYDVFLFYLLYSSFVLTYFSIAYYFFSML